MEDSSVENEKNHDPLALPPGFRFHPTDEEVISCYLSHKVMDKNFTAIAIAEADLNKCEPWDLPKRARMDEKEWFFFCQRDRKYPTGTRTNRATETGYWKATGKDREIVDAKGSIVGMKKTLVFYKGRAPCGRKTNWIMHEYRLGGMFSPYSYSQSSKDDWVVCKLFHKETTVIQKVFPSENPWIYSYEAHDIQAASSSATIDTSLFPQSVHEEAVFCFEGCRPGADYFPRQQVPPTLPCNYSTNYGSPAAFGGPVHQTRRSCLENDTASVSATKDEVGSPHGWCEDGGEQLDIMAMPDIDGFWSS